VGQQRGEVRRDIEATEIAQVLRQSLLGGMLIWSLYGDGSLKAGSKMCSEFFGMGSQHLTDRPHLAFCPMKENHNEKEIADSVADLGRTDRRGGVLGWMVPQRFQLLELRHGGIEKYSCGLQDWRTDRKGLVHEGDNAEPGQVLITFDDRELQAALSQSRARRKNPLADFARRHCRGACGCSGASGI
jgi:hypothetical protein